MNQHKLSLLCANRWRLMACMCLHLAEDSEIQVADVNIDVVVNKNRSATYLSSGGVLILDWFISGHYVYCPRLDLNGGCVLEQGVICGLEDPDDFLISASLSMHDWRANHQRYAMTTVTAG